MSEPTLQGEGFINPCFICSEACRFSIHRVQRFSIHRVRPGVVPVKQPLPQVNLGLTKKSLKIPHGFQNLLEADLPATDLCELAPRTIFSSNTNCNGPPQKQTTKTGTNSWRKTGNTGVEGTEPPKRCDLLLSERRQLPKAGSAAPQADRRPAACLQLARRTVPIR